MMHRPHSDDLFFTPEEEASRLPAEEWDVVATSPTRPALDPDGHEMDLTDAVVRAVRRS